MAAAGTGRQVRPYHTGVVMSAITISIASMRLDYMPVRADRRGPRAQVAGLLLATGDLMVSDGARYTNDMTCVRRCVGPSGLRGPSKPAIRFPWYC